METRFHRIDPRDNVAVALDGAEAGAQVLLPGVELRTIEPIPTAHKVALVAIRSGERIVKYGHPIGAATADIPAGGWVHTHNVRTELEGTREYVYEPSGASASSPPGEALKSIATRTFRGYPRPDGQVGIRNEIWIVPTVACVNRLAERLAAELSRELPAGVSSVQALTHPHGCGQIGEDLKRTQRLLADFVHHPNAAAVLVLGLGCEYNRVSSFREVVGPTDPGRVEYLAAQEVEDEVEAAREALRRLAAYAGRFSRHEQPVSKLRVGVKCGGSDAFSGLTANPLVGVVSDRLVAAGATVILSETTECLGAEHLMAERGATPEIGEQARRVVLDCERTCLAYGADLTGSNPSPGNIEGGLTTIEEKSLGCLRKGGTSRFQEVLAYAERPTRRGLVFMDTPGNDNESTAGMVAGGASVVMTEVPEMFGAEVDLLNRAADRDVFERGVAMINGIKRYFIEAHQPIYENPAPGNKDGGLTTLEEKSLGCTRKGGFAPVADVIDYAERIRKPGLSLLTSPGYDGVSVTALAASGAQILLFTTGRGNPLGTYVPTVKISSNSVLARRKPSWIDFDAGRLLEGVSPEELAKGLLELTLEVASGAKAARNEEHGYRDLVVWKQGVTV